MGWYFGWFEGAGIDLSGIGGRTQREEVDWEKRREEVREVMKESWKAYERDAWGTFSHLLGLNPN